MRIYTVLIALFLALNVSAQVNTVQTTSLTCSLKHPDTWIVRPSQTIEEITLSAPTPDFKEDESFIGTTLYVVSENSKFTSVEEAEKAYTEKIKHNDLLQKVSIQKTKKINFKGVDAYEIYFKCKVAGISTKCKMILFIHGGDYFELSVTYDSKLREDLVEEAFAVMDTFEFK